MEENKKVSFRLNETEIKKFKAFAEEQGINQAEAFTKLFEALELNKAKAIVSGRSKEIESIENHLNAIQGIYLTALEINQNAETVIKENYSRELNSKDSIIIGLQDKNKEFKEQVEQIKEVQKLNNELNKKVLDINKQLEERVEEVKKINESNSTLNSIVTEYKQFKVFNVELEESNKKLAEANILAKTELKDLNNKLEITAKDLNNTADFYKKEIARITTDSKQTVCDIRQTNENNLKELKKEHKETLKVEKEEHKATLKEVNVDNINTINLLKEEHLKTIENIENKNLKEIEVLKNNAAIEVATLKAENLRNKELLERKQKEELKEKQTEIREQQKDLKEQQKEINANISNIAKLEMQNATILNNNTELLKEIESLKIELDAKSKKSKN